MHRTLLIDTDFLCHRAWHTTGGLSYRDIQTGVVFGVLREAAFLLEWYKPARVAWCFDSRYSKRKELYPEYKGNRKPRSAEETQARGMLADEIKALRTEYLPELGFRNVLIQKGYEGDDIIAALAFDAHFSVQNVIVASDHDLYQCLRQNTKIFNPIRKKEYTIVDFYQDWNGIHPSSWPRVKAIAGCKTDNVPGISGIGEKTAAKWLAGHLERKTAAFKKIDDNLATITRNVPLVTLPFEGTEAPKLKSDNLTFKKWRRLANRLGMKSLVTDIGFPNMEK